MTKLLTSLCALAGLALFVGGCSGAADDGSDIAETEETAQAADALSSTTLSYVSLRKDTRTCAAPKCGGYYIKDVNRTMTEQYVSGLDFKPYGLPTDVINNVLAAPAKELVIYGKLGAVNATYGTRALVVAAAYRGLPGMVPATTDVFYAAKDRSPQISCFSAPCPNDVANTLNSTTNTYFSSYRVTRAAKSFVDQNWLVDRINQHGALVAGKIVNGTLYPAGYEKVLDASQVYLNVAAMKGPCPAFRLAACPTGQVWSYTRDTELCQLPDACIPDGGCMQTQPPLCSTGYTVSGWRVQATACMAYACDPSFVASMP